MKLRDVVRALSAAGCSIKHQGRHTKWACPCGQHSALIPRHATISPEVIADQADGVPARGVAAVSMTYKVSAKRWAHGWELHIDGVGVTQSRSLIDAEAMAREYVALALDVAEDSFAVQITPEVGDGLDDEVAAVRSKISSAARAQAEAAESSRKLVKRLKAKGLSGKDTAAVLGISPQRVSQLAGKGRRVATENVTAR